MITYDLKPNGKINRIQTDDGLAIIADGSEPWYGDLENAHDWQFVGGVWTKWRDELEENTPVFLSDQFISNKPGNPNITRKVFILESNHDWLGNRLNIVLGIRHIKSGVKFLDYDTKVTLEVSEDVKIFDNVSGTYRGAYMLFLQKQIRDGMSQIEALDFIVAEADSRGVIDNLIEIY